MRAKQDYQRKITQEQNKTNQFEKELFDSTNSDSRENSTSESESSVKTKKVSSLYAVF